MNSFLLFRENVRNTRNFQMLSNSTKKAVRYGLETVSHRPPFVWANLLQDYKSQTYFMPLNKKKENGMPKFVSVGSACITRKPRFI